MSVKFDEAFYCNGTLKDDIDVNNLIKIRLNSPSLFAEKYDGHLYCPDCHNPQLTLVHKNEHYFLRGYPNQKHDIDCSKGFEPLDDTVFQDFLDNDEHSFEFVANKLEKLIDKMQRRPFRQQEMLIRINNKRCTTDDVDVIDQNHRNSYKQIPVKSLVAPFDDDDFDRLKLFYGNVDLKVKMYNVNRENEFYALQIYLKGNNGLVCSITMNPAVGKHLLNKYNITENKYFRNQFLAVAASLRRKEEYKNGRLIHSDLCVIRS